MTGHLPTPIYKYEMPGTAWQLLWWLICTMDGKCEIRGGWRTNAARALKRDRLWISKCAEHLHRRGLVKAEPNKRYVKVLVHNIAG